MRIPILDNSFNPLTLFFSKLLGVAWLLFSCVASASDYSLGLEAYLQDDFGAARSHWSKGATANDAKSMFNLGLLHERKQVSDASSEKALSWFRLAGENGYAPADYHLALKLLAEASAGKSAEQNRAQAVRLLARSSDNGFKPAQNKLKVLGRGTTVRAKAPVSKSGKYRTEAWFKNKRGDHWTIQMLAFTEEEKVRAFIDDHGLDRQAAYFTEKARGETLYKLVYGIYASKDQADFARQNLSGELKQHGPWLRTISSVQSVIQRQ